VSSFEYFINVLYCFIMFLFLKKKIEGIRKKFLANGAYIDSFDGPYECHVKPYR
jgi:hypothetical protein